MKRMWAPLRDHAASLPRTSLRRWVPSRWTVQIQLTPPACSSGSIGVDRGRRCGEDEPVALGIPSRPHGLSAAAGLAVSRVHDHALVAAVDAHAPDPFRRVADLPTAGRPSEAGARQARVHDPMVRSVGSDGLDPVQAPVADEPGRPIPCSSDRRWPHAAHCKHNQRNRPTTQLHYCIYLQPLGARRHRLPRPRRRGRVRPRTPRRSPCRPSWPPRGRRRPR